ncbi:MAG: cyclic 2,3-diphosphoglycerate synthase [Candidatus Hermodarchaeota archaeon]|nr:cyclic 2,3-diphosphoglycerate synthase [Candidatus Hermodarchaeota archaeon]
MTRTRVIIMGAAGRDFHNFNVYFRDNEEYEVVAFTATQIPGIEERSYPSVLAGKLYPKGIPIYPEELLPKLIRENDVEQVIFAYSDIAHIDVMHLASWVHSVGADFRLMGPNTTLLKSKKPVIAICAVRTGSGKSQTSRRVVQILRDKGLKVVVIRHPMPYGDLAKQVCQRFETIEDLEKHDTTIEEMEEYEPHIDRGAIVYAGVDYGKILEEAEKEADVIIFDGGNNDFPFYEADVHIVIADPHRPGHEVMYHPGETNARMADVVIINKIDTAEPEFVEQVRRTIRVVNPRAIIIDAASPLYVDEPSLIQGKRVLVIEDGPTLTHGEMDIGAGWVAAQKYGAAEIIDPRPYAVGSIKETFEKFDHLSEILPAMGYGDEQVKELEKTINDAEADVVVIGTPIDLTRVVKINKPIVRVQYELQEIGKPTLDDVLRDFPAKK